VKDDRGDVLELQGQGGKIIGNKLCLTLQMEKWKRPWFNCKPWPPSWLPDVRQEATAENLFFEGTPSLPVWFGLLARPVPEPFQNDSNCLSLVCQKTMTSDRVTRNWILQKKSVGGKISLWYSMDSLDWSTLSNRSMGFRSFI